MSGESDTLAPLLQRLALDRHDRDAWSDVYQRLWGFVVALAFRFLRGNRDAAEDIAQEVFLRLVRYCPFDRLRTGDAFRAYVATATRNEVMSSFNREKARARAEGAASPPAPVPPPERFDWNELYGHVLDQLTPVDREILRLTDEGYDLSEIATRLGISSNNAAVRRSRARAQVRKYLQEQGLCP